MNLDLSVFVFCIVGFSLGFVYFYYWKIIIIDYSFFFFKIRLRFIYYGYEYFVCVWGDISVFYLIKINYLYRFRVGRVLLVFIWWIVWCWKVMRLRWWIIFLSGGSVTWSIGSDTRILNWWITILWIRCLLKVNIRLLYWFINVYCYYCYFWKFCWGS